jgi:peptidyl-prolyl cis-trans isomerase SurA
VQFLKKQLIVQSIILTLSMLAIVTGFPKLGGQEVQDIWTPPIKNGIVAKIEDEVITIDELRQNIWPLIDQIRAQSTTNEEVNEKMETIYKRTLQNLIDQILIIKAFNDKQYKFPENVVENKFNKVLSENFGNNRQTLLNYLEYQGLTVEEFRKKLKKEIIIKFMLSQMVKTPAEISPQQIVDFYKKNKKKLFLEEKKIYLRLIVFKQLPGQSQKQLNQIANEVMIELELGADFAQIAKKYSQDARKEQGGDWGWIKANDLRPQLSEKAFLLNKGQYSNPIKLDNQIFILLAEDIREQKIIPLEEAIPHIEQILAKELTKQSQERWIKQLRKDASIKYY